MLNPISGTYTIKDEAAKLFSNKHMKYQFRIVDSKSNGSVFIEPVRQNGDNTTGHMAAKLVTWAKLSDLNKVSE